LRTAAHLLRELFATHEVGLVDAALDSLTVAFADGVASIMRGAPGGDRLFDAKPHESRAALARIERDVYGATPTQTARVRLLAAAAAIAPRIELHVPVVDAGTHLGRIAIDLPRRVVAKFGSRVEPGDRLDGTFAHAFFDDESLIREAAAAGLGFVARRQAWIVLEKGVPTAFEHAAPFARELALALATAPRAEHHRQGDSPMAAVAAMREQGARRGARGPIGRARLRRAIGWVDAAYPGGGNCFRRVLVELALDAGAARDPLVFGLDVGKTGHVAFRDAEEHAFDVAFELPPPPLSP
jgi:hypothetical protein